MNARAEFLTTRFINAPAPGLPAGDRARKKMVEALLAVDLDITQQGAVSYETVELVRAALLLGRHA